MIEPADLKTALQKRGPKSWLRGGGGGFEGYRALGLQFGSGVEADHSFGFLNIKSKPLSPKHKKPPF